MLCAISGVQPEDPVASKIDGTVYSKRLILSYLSQNSNTDPVTGSTLTPDDLIDLKTSRTVTPRPPTLTSIPSLLATFQNEWDALAMETFTLKQQLAQTRQELSTALYDFEGALRVIAKIQKERDEAREALSRVTVGGAVQSNRGGAGASDGMVVDAQPLSDEVVEVIEATHKKLSGTRRKRPVPEGWATAEDVAAFEAKDIPDAALPGSRALAIDSTGDFALFGGVDGVAIIYSLSQAKTVQSLKCGSGAVTATAWAGERAVVGLSTGEVKIFEDDGSELHSSRVHAGPVTSLSLHPCGELLASTGSDKSYVIYEMKSLQSLTRVFTDSEITEGEFHPDGHLLATGHSNGKINVYWTKDGSIAATFDASNATSPTPVHSLSFSENGTFLASSHLNSTDVEVRDLRTASVIKTIEVGSQVGGVKWDYTGQYLGVAAAGGVTVEKYDKKAKSWTEVLRKGISARDVGWGAEGKAVVVLDGDGALAVLS